MDQNSVNTDFIVAKVLKRLQEMPAKNVSNTIPVEASARHIHLCQADVEALFGPGAQLMEKRPLSQPGQFLCQQRLRLVGPKGVFENVAILGPVRPQTQIELSRTDCVALGVQGPLRESGDLDGSGGSITLWHKKNFISLVKGVIVAKAHIHMTQTQAAFFQVADGQRVKVRINGARPIVLEDVIIRCNDNFSLALHIDLDEANACWYEKGLDCEILP